jgi:hypothetical protein
MAQPTINPWTAEVVPTHHEREYWQSDQSRHLICVLDVCGLINSIVVNVALMSKFHGKHESEWRGPAMALLLALIQLLLIGYYRRFYHCVRGYIQISQRSFRVLATLRGVTHPARTLSLFVDSTQGYLAAGAHQYAILHLVLLEPGIVLLATLNYNVPFRWHTRLFVAKLAIDLLGTAPLLARGIQHLQLEAHLLPWCNTIDYVTTGLFSIAPPAAPSSSPGTTQARTLCRSNPALYVPTFLLLSLGGIVPLVTAWCLEVYLKRSYLRARGHGTACISNWELSITSLLVLQLYAGIGLACMCAAGLVMLWPLGVGAVGA